MATPKQIKDAVARAMARTPARPIMAMGPSHYTVTYVERTPKYIDVRTTLYRSEEAAKDRIRSATMPKGTDRASDDSYALYHKGGTTIMLQVSPHYDRVLDRD